MHLIFVLTVILTQVIFTFSLDGHQFYAISNKEDRMYLRWVDNARFCKRLGDVVATKYISWDHPEYSWEYQNTGSPGQAHLLAHGNGYINNELTMENAPPYCSPKFSDYRFHKFDKIYYRIANLKTKKCLTSNGEARRISFEECKMNSGKQLWFFSEMALIKKLGAMGQPLSNKTTDKL